MAAPPLIRMLGVGRQAAEVRVRLYLWMFACSSARGFAELDLKRTTGEWALLTNLMTGPARTDQTKRSAAARKVARAMTYLEDQHLVERRGPDAVRLLDPSGDRRPYRPWSAETVRARTKEREDLSRFYGYRLDYRRSSVWEDRPLRLPARLWTNGTVSALSAPALAVLLVLWDYGQDSPGSPIEVPKSRAYEYPVAHSTWQKGTDQLRDAGLATALPGSPIFVRDNDRSSATTRRRIRWMLNYELLLGS